MKNGAVAMVGHRGQGPQLCGAGAMGEVRETNMVAIFGRYTRIREEGEKLADVVDTPCRASGS